MNWMRNLIAALRGGVPRKCDCCDKDTPKEDLIPIRGVAWCCPPCLNIILKPKEPKEPQE